MTQAWLFGFRLMTILTVLIRPLMQMRPTIESFGLIYRNAFLCTRRIGCMTYGIELGLQILLGCITRMCTLLMLRRLCSRNLEWTPDV